jgi:radical SAM superfamily enzyme YgiQ (UPF0313 family)
MAHLNSKLYTYKKCDVLLINPSYQPHWSCYEPTGLITLATYLNKKNINSRIIDLNLSKDIQESVCEIIIKNKIKIIGITAITRQAERAYKIGKLIKEKCSNTKIIYGGVHPTALPEEPFNKGLADYVIPYEGEKTLYQLSNSLIRNKSVNNISGILYRKNNEIFRTKKRNFFKDLNQLPFLDYKLVDLDKYNTNIHIPKYCGKTINMLTSRGCLGNCIYCNSPSFYKGNLRERSVKNVINEIKFQIKDVNIKNVHFTDDNFLSNPDRLKDICQLITKNKIKINWICIARADSIVKSKSVIKYMKQAGCVGVEIGVETPNTLILRQFNKNELPSDIIKANNILIKYKIKPMYLFMSYCPGETVNSPYQALELYCNLKKVIISKNNIPMFRNIYSEDLAGHIMRVSPGAQIYNLKDKIGIDLTKSWTDHFEENLGFLPNSILNDTPQLTNQKYLNKKILKKIYLKYKTNIRLFINQNFYISRFLFKKYFNNSHINLFESIYKTLNNIDGIKDVRKICELSDCQIQKTVICFSILSLLGVIKSKSCK